MGVQLEKLISERIKHTLARYESNDEYSEEARAEAIEALSSKWRKEVKQEILEELTQEEIQQQKESVDKAREKYSTQKAIEDLRVLVVEGIFLAIVVGLLVNQATDIITYLKGKDAYIATLIIIAVLALVLFGYVMSRLASTISKLLKK